MAIDVVGQEAVTEAGDLEASAEAAMAVLGVGASSAMIVLGAMGKGEKHEEKCHVQGLVGH
jgi:hypothetical protein